MTNPVSRCSGRTYPVYQHAACTTYSVQQPLFRFLGGRAASRLPTQSCLLVAGPKLRPNSSAALKINSSALAFSWLFTIRTRGSEFLRIFSANPRTTLRCMPSKLRSPRPPRCREKYKRGTEDLGCKLRCCIIFRTSLSTLCNSSTVHFTTPKE